MSATLVVGGGIAGAAAAYGANQQGHTVTWWRGGVGASAFGTGAADLEPWNGAPDDEPLSPELTRFVTALAAFRVSSRGARVVSALGAVRRARLCDPLVLDLTVVLDLAARRGGVLGVVGDGESPLDLAAALAESAELEHGAVRLSPLSCPSVPRHVRRVRTEALSPGERDVGDAEFRELCEQLAGHEPRVDAWLLPEGWLLDDVARLELERRLGVPVGTTLCGYGGALGERLQARLEHFSPPGVEIQAVYASALHAQPEGVLARDAEGRERRFDHAVVCIGGVAGGGVQLDAARQLRPSLELGGVEASVRRARGTRSFDVAAATGIDFAQLGIGASLRFALTTRGQVRRIALGGECSSECPATLLGAAQSALDVVQRLGAPVG